MGFDLPVELARSSTTEGILYKVQNRGCVVATKIENLSGRKILIRLSSGQTLHIAPRATSEELSDVEVQNPKVQKLQDRRVIALHRTETRRSATRGSGSSKGSGSSASDS